MQWVLHLTVRSLPQWLYFPLLFPNENCPPGSTTLPCSLHFLSMDRPRRHTASPLLPLSSIGLWWGLQTTPQSMWHSTWQHIVKIQLLKIAIINLIVLANPFPFPSTSRLIFGLFHIHWLVSLAPACIHPNACQISLSDLPLETLFILYCPQLPTRSSPTSPSQHTTLSTLFSQEMGRPHPTHAVLSPHHCQKHPHV